MTKSESRDVEIEMVPLDGSEGKLISGHPFDSATICWTGADGRESERADVAPDGAFFFNQRHDGNETMTVVTAKSPQTGWPVPWI